MLCISELFSGDILATKASVKHKRKNNNEKQLDPKKVSYSRGVDMTV